MNDNPPDAAAIEINIRKGTPPDFPIGRLNGDDPDAGDNGTITYEIIGDDQNSKAYFLHF